MIMYLRSMLCPECEMSNMAVITITTFGMFGIILVNVAGMHSLNFCLLCGELGMLMGMFAGHPFIILYISRFVLNHVQPCMP